MKIEKRNRIISKNLINREEKENLISKFWKSRRERDLCFRSSSIKNRKRTFLKNIENQEEKECVWVWMGLKISEIEKRFFINKSWKSRIEKEMKIQFSRASEKIRSNFFSRFFEIETLVNDWVQLHYKKMWSYNSVLYRFAFFITSMYSYASIIIVL